MLAIHSDAFAQLYHVLIKQVLYFRQPCANQVILVHFAVSLVPLEALVQSVAASVFRSVQMMHVTMSMDVLKIPEPRFKQRFRVLPVCC